MSRVEASRAEADSAGATSGQVSQAGYRLRGMFDLRFADARLERAYRAFFLDSDKRHAMLAIGVYAVLQACFAVLDPLLQTPEALPAVLLARFAFVGCCAVAMVLLMRVRRHGQYEVLIFAWVALMVASTFYTASRRPPDFYGFASSSPLLILLIFGFFRNRFELQVLGVLLLVAADVFTLLALREPAGAPLLMQVSLSYATAMLVGVMVSRQLKLSRRQLYAGLVNERDVSEAMRELAFRDELTGVLNRRSFLQQAGADWDERVAGRGGCVLLLDLDYFKSLNDRHGHDAGDQALVGFARMVEGVKRECDLFGRVGGEEFALLLPGLSLASAEAMAQAIMDGCRVLLAEGGESLSVSIGIARIEACDGNLAACLLRADRALYRAKAGGRGRSCVAGLDQAIAAG